MKRLEHGRSISLQYVPSSVNKKSPLPVTEFTSPFFYCHGVHLTVVIYFKADTGISLGFPSAGGRPWRSREISKEQTSFSSPSTRGGR